MKRYTFLLLTFLFVFIMSGCGPKVAQTGKKLPIEAVSLQEEGWEEVVFVRGDYRSIVKKAVSGSLAPIKFKKLPGYFLKTSVPMSKNMNFFTVNSEKKLNEMLGKSQTTKETYDHNLSKSFVAVIAVSPSTNSYNINISNVFVEGTQLYVLYSMTPIDEIGVRYLKMNSAIFEIERPRAVTTVHFINEIGNGIAIPYGRRSENSPKNIKDMLKNYTGTFKGSLTAYNTAGSELIMELQLFPDFTFILKQSYSNNKDRVFESRGNWATTEDLSSFVLNYDKSDTEQIKFYFINKKSIERLARNGDKFDSGNNILTK